MKIRKIKNIFFLAGAMALTFAACDEKTNPDVDPADTGGEDTTPRPGARAINIPLCGNTYVTSGYGVVSDRDLSGWVDAVFSSYFKLRSAGDLSLFLKYTTPTNGYGTPGNSVIDVEVGEAPAEGEAFTPIKTFRVTLPKTPAGKDSIVFIGKLDRCEIGYKRIDFKGVSKGGSEFYGTLKTLIAEGQSTPGMSYSHSDRRNSPSVHMGYPYPSTDTAAWFYNEVTVPDGMDHPASYFMVSGFTGGYFGIQPAKGRPVRVLFSVWAEFATDNPESVPDSLRVPCFSKGTGVTHQMFGGEGSGTQTFYHADGWKTGLTYKFITNIYPSRDIGFTDYKAVDYVGYIFDPVAGEWKLLAWLRRRTSNLTYYQSAYSFVENFSGASGNLMRKACFGNQWIYTKGGEWKEITTGQFSTDATGSSGERRDYDGGVTEDGKFFLQNGGFFNNTATPGTKFTRPATGTPPDVDFALLERLKEEGKAVVQQEEEEKKKQEEEKQKQEQEQQK
ncbi:MAG: DUF3472 domain-containing protein [Prevotellaceae bacterium]|jgi:hypothetical protein|nr:DUF3472 domain-containing protein [Prevotellaceae bacterium]